MASLEPEAVIEESVNAETTSLGLLKAENTTSTASESKDANISVKEDEVPAVPAEDLIVDAGLLETSIFVGEYLPYTPPPSGEDDVRPFE